MWFLSLSYLLSRYDTKWMWWTWITWCTKCCLCTKFPQLACTWGIWHMWWIWFTWFTRYMMQLVHLMYLLQQWQQICLSLDPLPLTGWRDVRIDRWMIQHWNRRSFLVKEVVGQVKHIQVTNSTCRLCSYPEDKSHVGIEGRFWWKEGDDKLSISR